MTAEEKPPTSGPAAEPPAVQGPPQQPAAKEDAGPEPQGAPDSGPGVEKPVIAEPEVAGPQPPRKIPQKGPAASAKTAVDPKDAPRADRARFESATSRIAKLRKSLSGTSEPGDGASEPDAGPPAPPAAKAPPQPPEKAAAKPPAQGGQAPAAAAPASGAAKAAPSNAVVPVKPGPPPAREAAKPPAAAPARPPAQRPAAAQLPAPATPPAAPPARRQAAEARPALPAPQPAPRAQGKAASRWAMTRPKGRMSSSRAAILSMTSQEAPLETAEEGERDIVWFAQASLMRLIGVAWLAVTVLIWGRLIGYLDADLTIAWHAPEGPWMAVMVSAIMAPVVSVGLWLAASWGIVVWLAATGLGIYALIVAPVGTVPLGWPGIAANIVGLVVVCALAGLRAWRDRDLDD